MTVLDPPRDALPPLGRVELFAEMSRRITDLEMRSSVQMTVAMALAKAGADSTEAEHLLWQHMDALDALRLQRMVLQTPQSATSAVVRTRTEVCSPRPSDL